MSEAVKQGAVNTAAAGERKERKAPLWKKLLFSDVLLFRPISHKLAYIGVMAALCIAVNTFEIKFADTQFSFSLFTDTQFSFSLFTALLAGVTLGALPGAVAVFVGDLFGYLLNSAGMYYYWWVALSLMLMAVIAGLVMRIPMHFKGSLFVKLAIVTVLTFSLCTVLVNSLGMYYIGINLFSSQALIDAINERFGGVLTFGNYVFVRLFVLGQIYNSILNYILAFLAIPLLNAVKPLKLGLE